jgi:hypothetical protein
MLILYEMVGVLSMLFLLISFSYLRFVVSGIFLQVLNQLLNTVSQFNVLFSGPTSGGYDESSV